MYDARTAQKIANDVNGLGDELRNIYSDIRDAARLGRYQVTATITKVNADAIEGELKSNGYRISWHTTGKQTEDITILWSNSRTEAPRYTPAKG